MLLYSLKHLTYLADQDTEIAEPLGLTPEPGHCYSDGTAAADTPRCPRTSRLQGTLQKTYAAQHMWTLDTFIGYLHSTSLASKAARGQELRQTLLALEPSGLLRETAGFSCLTARRPHQADSATRSY